MESKAAEALAPSGDGTNNTTVVKYTLDGTARNAELPAFLHGQRIRVTPVGTNVTWYISTSSSAAVDRTTAASDTGAQAATIGEYVASGTGVERTCPYAQQGAKLYLCWQGDAAGTFLQIAKASGRPFSVTADV
jgi:hypothetical protein